MKKILLGALVVAAMASCSKNEVIDTPQSNLPKIEFAKAQLGNSIISKADITSATISQIGVFAFDGTTPFDPYDGITNELLSKTGENWALANTHYYPATGTVNFWAYAAHTTSTASEGITAVPTCTDAAGPSIAMTIPVTATKIDATDALVDAVVSAKITAQDKNSSAIAFQFAHILSKVVVTSKYKTDYNTDFTAKLTSVKIAAKNSGTYVSNPAAWTPGADAAVDYVFVGSAKDVSTIVATLGEVNIIPQSDVVLSVAYDVYKGDIKVNTHTGTKTFTPTAGNSYTFNLLIDPSAAEITFTDPTVGGFTAQTPVDVVVP